MGNTVSGASEPVSLDLQALKQAVSRLEESLGHCRSPAALEDPSLSRTLQAGAIQAFEFTYELAWKTLKRFLVATEPNPAAIEELSFPDLIRMGNRRGLLLSEWDRWKRYRQQRGITSHTYDPRKAVEVFAELPGFLGDARFLLERLEERVARP